VTATIGLIGGMGPAASVDLYREVTEATPADLDQDHLRLLIDSNPAVPNRQDAILRGGPSPAPLLVASAQGLERMGADFLVMACNTAHAWEDEIRAAVAIPFMSMITTTVERATAVAPAASRVGVLATDGCLAANLYQSALKAVGLEAVLPDGAGQARLMAAIAAIKGRGSSHGHVDLAGLADELVSAGAEVLIAGCTEVPLLLHDRDTSVPLVNSTRALALAAVAQALGP
jgi:aspartate racemase